MKILRECFLFQPCCRERKTLFWLWNWGWLIMAAVGTSILSLLLARGQYRLQIFLGYFRHPMIFLLNTLPVVMLIVLLYCLIGRAWIAFLAGSAPVMAMSVGNYFKLLCRDDPFLFADVPDITTAMGVAGRYDISMDGRLALCLLCLALGTAFLYLFVRGRPRNLRWRLLGAAALVLGAIPLGGLYTNQNIYANKTQNYEYASQWSATQVFLSRGFLYPFLHSIPDAFPEKPAGYSQELALEILSSYTAEDIPEERRVNVIGIQLEAFNDLERLGFTGISPEVYERFHALEAESYAGSLITDIFAGGTIQTERSFLTGDADLDNFRRATGSYVRYFSEQGYATEGSHPCYDYFYNRKNVNLYLGFDQYWFFENRYGAITGGYIGMDDTLFPDLWELYQARDASRPYFQFSVTYQGHGPYTTDALDGGGSYWIGDYQEESTYYILNNYLHWVHNTGENLAAFADALREDEAPVVLVAFGDHNPWLGYGNSVYQEQDINLDTSTEEGFRNYYGTRYLIWANNAARTVLGNDFTGTGPDVSPCFLMNVLFEQCGWGAGSAFMQTAEELRELSGVVSENGFYIETEGGFTREPSAAVREAQARYEIAQFYRKQHPEW